MKKVTLFIIALCAYLSSVADENIIVRQTSGDLTLPASSISYITFPSEGGIYIATSSGSEYRIDASRFVSLRFDGNGAGVSSIVITQSGPATAYDLNGKVVATVDDITTLSQVLPSGVYIIKTSDKSFKYIVP